MRLILLVGLPGSGKTTYAKNLIENDASIVWLSSDKIRQELYGDESIQGDANKVFTLMQSRARDNLLQGRTVIYDATNVNRKSRKSAIALTKGTGATVEAHIVWCPYEDCINRDLSRDRTVGEEVIHKFLYRWETPYYDEGIDKIVVVHNVSNEFDTKHYHETLTQKMMIPHENPHHTLGVYEHCLCAYEQAFKGCNDKVVIEGARLHDIGKPMAKFYAKDSEGNVTKLAHYYNHHNIGGYLVLGCFEEKENDFAIDVSWLITNHMEPFFDSSYYKKTSGLLRERIDTLHNYDLNAH
jgi:predicted kinase